MTVVVTIHENSQCAWLDLKSGKSGYMLESLKTDAFAVERQEMVAPSRRNQYPELLVEKSAVKMRGCRQSAGKIARNSGRESSETIRRTLPPEMGNTGKR